jgi:hypothetical protein
MNIDTSVQRIESFFFFFFGVTKNLQKPSHKGEKKGKKGGNAAKNNYSRDPISHIMSAKVKTSVNFPSPPKRGGNKKKNMHEKLSYLTASPKQWNVAVKKI